MTGLLACAKSFAHMEVGVSKDTTSGAAEATKEAAVAAEARPEPVGQAIGSVADEEQQSQPTAVEGPERDGAEV
jgi:hypothetical protein